MENAEKKIEKIVEEYSCYDVHGETCDNDCEYCKKLLRDELNELIELIKTTPRKS